RALLRLDMLPSFGCGGGMGRASPAAGAAGEAPEEPGHPVRHHVHEPNEEHAVDGPGRGLRDLLRKVLHELDEQPPQDPPPDPIPTRNVSEKNPLNESGATKARARPPIAPAMPV